MVKFMMSVGLIFFVSLFVNNVYSQSGDNGNRTFYIVRHAEKETGNDPGLTEAGRKRAGDLYRLLQNKKIDLIFSSNYKRTMMTGDSLRLFRKVDTVLYVPDMTGEKLFERIAERAGNANNILIIGHSNTLPGIIRKAGVDSYTVKELPESEYDNFFIVELKDGKVKSFKQEKYGQASPPAQGGGSSMQMQ